MAWLFLQSVKLPSMCDDCGITLLTLTQTGESILNESFTIVEIAFFTVTGIVAVLSYRSAKRTVFQPMRTEIFKKQVELLTSILEMLAGKDEGRLKQDFGFPLLIRANVERMLDAYARLAFGKVPKPEERSYRLDLCPGGMLIVNEHDVLLDYTFVAPSTPPPTEAGEWDYRHREVRIPRSYYESQRRFQEALDNPVLPSRIANLLESYLSIVDENIKVMPTAIEAVAAKMPKQYPTEESWPSDDPLWPINECNHELKPLEPTAKVIIDTVRSYFDPDNLVPKPRSHIKPKMKSRKTGANPL